MKKTRKKKARGDSLALLLIGILCASLLILVANYGLVWAAVAALVVGD